jgi:hypothetical protein
MNTYLKKFIAFINLSSEYGKKLISVSQQMKKGKDKFYIHPIYKNNKLYGINVEYDSLPGDTILKLKVFDVVIIKLLNSENNILKKGNAQKKGVKLGNKDLDKNTLENHVAFECYNKSEGSVFRRMPVIANILSEAGICENIRSGSKLKLIP